MNKFDKKILLTAAVLGAVTIMIGAFGAHGLKQLVSEEAVASFETGVRYQMYHVLALLVLGWSTLPQPNKKWVSRFFLGGILLFSGSIYLLALKDYLPFSTSFLGPITPIGGTLLIIGWIILGVGIFRIKTR